MSAQTIAITYIDLFRELSRPSIIQKICEAGKSFHFRELIDETNALLRGECDIVTYNFDGTIDETPDDYDYLISFNLQLILDMLDQIEEASFIRWGNN